VCLLRDGARATRIPFCSSFRLQISCFAVCLCVGLDLHFVETLCKSEKCKVVLEVSILKFVNTLMAEL
jgi:hypothetical protein